VKAKLEIAKINVRDVGGKSGNDQDGLDTLINLMSEKILEVKIHLMANYISIFSARIQLWKKAAKLKFPRA